MTAFVTSKELLTTKVEVGNEEVGSQACRQIKQSFIYFFGQERQVWAPQAFFLFLFAFHSANFLFLFYFHSPKFIRRRTSNEIKLLSKQIGFHTTWTFSELGSDSLAFGATVEIISFIFGGLESTPTCK